MTCFAGFSRFVAFEAMTFLLVFLLFLSVRRAAMNSNEMNHGSIL